MEQLGAYSSSSAANVLHGSHPHPLQVLVFPALTSRGGPAANATGKSCGVCRAGIDRNAPKPAHRCVQCSDFYLCGKCFEIDETPLTAPQFVVREPSLSKADPTVFVRTRPRLSAYPLCPVPFGELIEVISFAESTDEPGCQYFRQKVGGWISAKHVVCVCPSEGPIAQLASIHIHYAATASSQPVSLPAVMNFVDEAVQLLHESPPFGFVQAYLTLLPVRLYVETIEEEEAFGEESGSSSSSQDEATGDVVDFVSQFLSVAVNELEQVVVQPNVNGALSPYLCFLVHACGRALHVLWHLPIQFTADAPLLVELASRAASVLLSVTNLPSRKRNGSSCALLVDGGEYEGASPSHGGDDYVTSSSPYGTSMLLSKCVDIWKSVLVENENAATRFDRAQHAAPPLLEVAGRLLMEGPRLPPHRYLAPIRTAVLLLPNELCGALPSLFLNAMLTLLQLRIANGSVEDLAKTQWELLNLDMVEFIVRILKFQRDGALTIPALRLLVGTCYRNPRLVSMVQSVVTSHVVQALRAACHEETINAAFDACAALAFNAPPTDDASRSGAAAQQPPHCTALMHPQCAPFQEIHSVVLPNGVRVVLCAHCASAHMSPSMGAAVAEPRSFPLAYGYVVCQCAACCLPPSGLSDQSTPISPPPNIALTAAQKQLGTLRVLSVMTQKLRTHGAKVANAVGRLSVLLCCTEDVAQALFCALVDVKDLSVYQDACVALGACKYFGQIQYLMQRYATSAVARYLNNPYVAGIGGHCAGPRSVHADPSRIDISHVDKTPGSLNASTLGLTPSPAKAQGDVCDW